MRVDVELKLSTHCPTTTGKRDKFQAQTLPCWYARSQCLIQGKQLNHHAAYPPWSHSAGVGADPAWPRSPPDSTPSPGTWNPAPWPQGNPQSNARNADCLLWHSLRPGAGQGSASGCLSAGWAGSQCWHLARGPHPPRRGWHPPGWGSPAASAAGCPRCRRAGLLPWRVACSPVAPGSPHSSSCWDPTLVPRAGRPRWRWSSLAGWSLHCSGRHVPPGCSVPAAAEGSLWFSHSLCLLLLPLQGSAQ